ncbi:very long chain fatty acid elongase AAEL008004-like [Ornithodoros turicata]|uniref:very long chain fatty acid elongase AAEL008004-like n=1 Tax=Ornithodoros turicata TaxID=34597 RepID=UPI0031396231
MHSYFGQNAAETMSQRFDSSPPLFMRDPRTKDWFIAGNVPLLLTLLVGYVYFVKVSGPRFMKSRKPMEHLKPVIIVYNGAMVLANVYFCYKFLRRTYFGGGYNPVCQGIDFQAKDKNTIGLLELCWWYLWVRVADFLDTVFFVLRKKDAHISLLHVVHHCLVVFNGWYGIAYGADGQIMSGVCLNSFVHVVMYSYYFLSLLGPAMKKYLWWKRHLTQLQIAQFVIIFCHGTIPLAKDCGYPRTHIFIGIPQGVFFLTMFIKFYMEAYGKQRMQRAAKVQ